MAVDPLAGERVLAFDTETTGISTSRSRIVQFALVGSDVDGAPVHIEHLIDLQRSRVVNTLELQLGRDLLDIRNSEAFNVLGQGARLQGLERAAPCNRDGRRLAVCRRFRDTIGL